MGDTFDIQSGLPTDVVIHPNKANVWFGENEDNENDERLHLHIEGPATVDGEDEEEFLVRLSMGTGWEDEDEGRTALHTSGKNGPRQNTGQAHVVKSLIEVANERGGKGAVDEIKALARDADNGTNTAEFWEGFESLTLERVKVGQFPSRENPDEMIDHLAFLVRDYSIAGSGKSKSKGKGKGKSKGKAEAGRSGDSDPEGAFRAKVVKLAAKHDDYDEFVEAVEDKYEDELEEYPDVYAAVLDEDEIWDEVHG